MKTNKIVLALLFSGASAIKVTQQPLSLSQAAKDAGAKMQATLNAMSDEDIQKMAQDQIKDAKKGDDKPKSKDEAEAKDAEMKAIEGALARRVLDRLGPYSYPYYPLTGSPILDRAVTVRAYNDMVLGYEAANAGYWGYPLVPSSADVRKVLDVVTNTEGMVAGKNGVPVPADPVNYTGKLGAAVAAVTAPQVSAESKKPAEKSLVQVDEQGVPVLVQPKLLPNEAADIDLRQRDIIMDGVDGYAFVQLTDEEKPIADMDSLQKLDGHQFLQKMFGQASPEPPKLDQLIQTEGVPVLVNPESMLDSNQMASAGLGLPLLVGPDDVSAMQHRAQGFDPVFDDAVTLQVNGVPVYVRPESMLSENSMGTVSLGLNITMGPDDVKFAQKSKPNKRDLLQIQNPVENPPFNNWSVNQPSVPHDSGDAGNQDLGQRNYIIDGVNGFDFVQLANPVENPPFNNWSVNQPSVPHDNGDAGHQDLGVRNIIIDGVNGYDF